MTITRIAQAGMETGSNKEFDYVHINTATSTANAKTGNYALYGNSHQCAAYKYLSSVSYQIRGGYFFRYGGQYDYTVYPDIFKIMSGSTVLARMTVTQGRLFNLTTGGTWRDNAVSLTPFGDYFHLGFDFKIDSSAGWAKVYIDGLEALSYTGNTGTDAITHIILGTNNSSSTYQLYYTYIDDFYLDDTTGEGSAAIPPILRFPLITPNGNGNYDGNWSGSDGNSVNNYELVDEIPLSESDYITKDSADSSESFAMGTYTLGTNESCVAVIPTAFAKKNSSTEQIALGTRVSSTDSIGSDQNPVTSYYPLFNRQTTKPGGGSWDQSAIDGLEVVLKSRGTY